MATQLSRTLLVSVLLALLSVGAQAHGPRDHPKAHWRARALLVELDAGVTIKVNETAFTRQRQAVEVTWSGVVSPNVTGDYIAVYSPATVDPTETLPVTYFSCSEDPAHATTGAGTASVLLVNTRDTYKFTLVRGGILAPQIVAESPVLTNEISAAPTGGHLAIYEDEKSVVVQWVSNSSATQYVQWGDAPANGGEYPHDAASTNDTYQASDMCGFPANSTGWLDPGFLHSAIIPADMLTPGKRVYYRFGAEEPVGWSEEFSFIAPHGPGALNSSDGETPFVFLAFNDVCMTSPLLFLNPTGLRLGDTYGENSTYLAQRLREEDNANLALMVGDISYAMGYAVEWDVFNEQYEPAFTQWPLMVGTGNHERDWPGTGDAFNDTADDSGGECNVPFMYRFYTPANAQRDPFMSYYSFRQGPVTFLILDSETASDPASKQGSFVAKTLAAVDRSVTPWVVAIMHRMMAAPATYSKPLVGDLEVMARLQSDYQDLFQQYQVDFVVSGHEHAYARSCPMYSYGCTANATKDAVTQQVEASLCPTNLTYSGNANAGHVYPGGSGGPVFMLAGHAGAGFTHGFPTIPDPWMDAGAQDVNGYLRFTATSSVLRMEAVAAREGCVMDYVELRR